MFSQKPPKSNPKTSSNIQLKKGYGTNGNYAIEKMRKLLSGNKETDINVDSLMEDEDFQKHITREEFETTIDGFMREFTLCLKTALAKSGLSSDHIDFVELVGEATRIPSILE